MTTVQQLIDKLMLINDKSIRVDIVLGDDDGTDDRETSEFALFSEHDEYVEIYIEWEELGL